MRKLLFAAFALVLIVPLSYEIAMMITPYNSSEIIVEIPKGMPASLIGAKLAEEGVIRSKFRFIAYVRFTGIENELSYGEYLIPANSNFIKVINRLRDANIVYHQLTIIEGLTLKETAILVEQKGFGDSQKFLSLCSDSLFIKELTNMPVATLEGFLYPDTYNFPKKASEEYIIRHIVDHFFKIIDRIGIPENYPYSLYEMITLASIVEKEATFCDEKPLIAGVYLNRLQIGKRLQADPTVAYILAQRGIRRKTIFYVDLETDSPYNTYRNNGLPPTPICSPYITSLNAVFNPEESEYLFFFADRKGRHIFSRTYREHLDRQRALRNSST